MSRVIDEEAIEVKDGHRVLETPLWRRGVQTVAQLRQLGRGWGELAEEGLVGCKWNGGPPGRPATESPAV